MNDVESSLYKALLAGVFPPGFAAHRRQLAQREFDQVFLAKGAPSRGQIHSKRE